MLYRTVAVFIVLFWLTMTGLLIHRQVRPEDSALREVPAPHVMKLMFMHHEVSRLNIYSEKLRLGRLILTPRVGAQGQDRDLEFEGDFQIPVPHAKRERIAWQGVLQMDKLLAIQRFQLKVETHTPEDVTTELVIVPEEKLAHVTLSIGNGAVERQNYTLDEQGARTALEQLGLDPALLPISTKPQTTAPFEVKARQSTLTLHGETMDTYLVTVESNGQTLLECHVDALGRVVRANTLLGYTFAPDDVTP